VQSRFHATLLLAVVGSSAVAARLVHVARSDDPALSPYMLLREKDLVRGARLFVAEGEVVVRVLVTRGRFRVRSLLLEARRTAAVGDVLDMLSDDVAAYVVPQAVMNEVVGFEIHRGVLALGERGPELAPSAVLGNDGVVVGLVGLTNHDNVGGIFRNAAAFGARGVLYDLTTCDPLYRKAIRVSVGAALVVPFAAIPTASSMLDALCEHGFEVIALTPRGEETLGTLPPHPRRALLVGAEGDGLPDSVLARARSVRIDMAPGLDSLNVAVASGIALYEATRR
jgi:tRNA G18 (ribose-2'-O)-methylase SpoU